MLRGKKEACRNFIRGSCQYGDRCKFSHSSPNIQQQQQQPRTNNPFGFGTAWSNNQSKPFQNKWTRDSATAPSDQSQPAPANHTCTTPELCKRQMVEDFQNEKPLWKLTCYGHFKHLPCDIVGDISYEELRAAAYDDAKKGLSLSAVIGRERNMVNAKLMEFENLMRTPCVPPTAVTGSVSPFAVTGSVSPFPTVNIAQSPTTGQNNASPQPVSSFSQLGFTTNQESKTSAVASSNSSFGQQSSFPNPGHTSGSFGANNLNFGYQGLFGKQQHMQSQGNVSTINPFSFGGNLTTSSTNSVQPMNVASNQTFGFSIQRNAVDSLGRQTYVEKGQGSPTDKSIWLKDKWNPGEIPEEAPPSDVCI